MQSQAEHTIDRSHDTSMSHCGLVKLPQHTLNFDR